MWEITITAYAGSFEGLKRVVADECKRVAAAKDHRQLNTSWGGGMGGSMSGVGASLKVTCPVEERIKQLRADADALEAKLQSGEA